MPDGNPKYARQPRPDSVFTFIRYLTAKPVVDDVHHDHGLIYRVVRPKLGTLIVHFNNIYTVGEADVHEILAEHPDVSVIVTASAWNSYTRAAKQLAKDHQVGLFTFSEFMGAVFHEGESLLNYVPKADRL